MEEASGGAERQADSQDKGSRVRRLPRARRKLRWAGVGDEEQLEGRSSERGCKRGPADWKRANGGAAGGRREGHRLPAYRWVLP